MDYGHYNLQENRNLFGNIIKYRKFKNINVVSNLECIW